MIIDSKIYNGACSCGRNHEMVTKAAILEPDCLKKLEYYFDLYGIKGKRCALYGENSYKATEGRHPVADQVIIMESDGLHANEISTGKVLSILEPDVEIIIAIGSGTIHDIARFCAHERGIRFISCPTGASVDGFCSTVAAMTWHGYKKTLPAVAPEIVLADISVIKKAPSGLVRSGIGDIIAKYTALADWRISNIVTGEYLCERIFSIMSDALKMAVDSIEGIKEGQDDAFIAVTYALVMSGLAMQMMGNSRPASGAEHHFSHLIEMEPRKLKAAFPAMHGEKTGVGSVYVLKEYKRLSTFENIEPFAVDYSPLGRGDIVDFFGGSLAEAILKENTEDCLGTVTKELLIEKWPEIRKIIADLPSGEEIYELLNGIGAKCTAESIGIHETDVPVILNYSPAVRNRLTLMRIRRMVRT